MVQHREERVSERLNYLEVVRDAGRIGDQDELAYSCKLGVKE